MKYTAEDYRRLASRFEHAAKHHSEASKWIDVGLNYHDALRVATALRIASRATEEGIAGALEPVAVALVGQVVDRLQDGKLYAYEGIEAARDIRDQCSQTILKHLSEE